jgi:hypothetical protein
LTPRLLYTIGYEGSSREAVIDELENAGVQFVIDTRETPTSRRPEFRRRVLQESLLERGIGYAWMPDLGVPKPLRQYARSNRGVFVAAYLRRLQRFSASTSEAAQLAWSSSVALLCFESDETECHRSILAGRLATINPFSATHLRVGRGNNTDDEPRSPSMVRSNEEMQVATR